jgi:hypothetical protein
MKGLLVPDQWRPATELHVIPHPSEDRLLVMTQAGLIATARIVDTDQRIPRQDRRTFKRLFFSSSRIVRVNAGRIPIAGQVGPQTATHFSIIPIYDGSPSGDASHAATKKDQSMSDLSTDPKPEPKPEEVDVKTAGGTEVHTGTPETKEEKAE